jgi:hypothetical protein
VSSYLNSTLVSGVPPTVETKSQPIPLTAISDGDKKMNANRPTLTEVLYPPCFAKNPKQAAVTRIIRQMDTDKFEQAETARARESRPQSSGQAVSSPASNAGGAA